MSDMIRSFQELTTEQQSSAGGKGGTLARLYQAGYPVPDGFVILPLAFDPSTSRRGELVEPSGQRGDELKPEDWAQVQAHLKRLRKGDPDATNMASRASPGWKTRPRVSATVRWSRWMVRTASCGSWRVGRSARDAR